MAEHDKAMNIVGSSFCSFNSNGRKDFTENTEFLRKEFLLLLYDFCVKNRRSLQLTIHSLSRSFNNFKTSLKPSISPSLCSKNNRLIRVPLIN